MTFGGRCLNMRIKNDAVNISESDLISLFIEDSDFASLSEELSPFCPFEALGIVNQEIRHSNLLAQLLQPNSSHGFEDKCLRVFLDAIFNSLGDAEARLELHTTDLSNVEIRREWRNIDLLIHLPDFKGGFVIAVELKIWSGESSGQLKKYEEIVRRTWTDCSHLFVFLTPTGAEASRDTWQNLSIDRIVDGLEKITDGTSGHTDARRLLAQYCEMLRRHILTNENLEKIAKNLWVKHEVALEYLIEQKPDVIRDLSDYFQETENFGRIISIVESETKLTLEKLHSSSTFFRFTVGDWKNYPDVRATQHKQLATCLGGEIEFYNGKVEIRFVLTPGEANARRNIYNALKASNVGNIGRSKKLSADWTRLASDKLYQIPKVEKLEDFDKIAKKLEAGAIGFLISHLDNYNTALKVLKKPQPT